MCWHTQKILSPWSVTATSGHNGLRLYQFAAAKYGCKKDPPQAVPGVIYPLASAERWPLNLLLTVFCAFRDSAHLWRQTCKMDFLRFNSHTTVFTLSDAFLASRWLQDRRLCSGDITWSAGTRYFAKLPFCSNISVDVRVAAQLSAGRPI